MRSPEASKALALVNEIKATFENGDGTNARAQAGLLIEVSKLRDSIEAPLDSVLRMWQQVKTP